jgi:hypothetical protein
MTKAVSLAAQTAYADLLDRVSADAFAQDFAEDGNFVSKDVASRRYWYFENKTAHGYRQKYVGAETSELLQRIREHKQVRADERDRRRIVSSLATQNMLPRPVPAMGALLSALSRAGVFRLGGVLVGTTAYQAYSAMLGIRLPAATLQTGDVDVAARNVSVAAGERLPPMLDVLKDVDTSFREVAHISRKHVTAYRAAGGLRLDFLTPNEGPDTDVPRRLTALNTDAQPMRFLGYLIQDAAPAVLLHDAGVFVRVPLPSRYCLHKLVVAQRRGAANPKREKDLRQAEVLLGVLVERQPNELLAAWDDCWARGPKWRTLLTDGLARIDPSVRDDVLRVAGQMRSVVAGTKLTIGPGRLRHDFDSDTVYFLAEDGGRVIRCAISRAALDDHFKPEGEESDDRLRIVRENRGVIEQMVEAKYLHFPVEQAGAVLIATRDVPALRAMVGQRPGKKR